MRLCFFLALIALPAATQTGLVNGDFEDAAADGTAAAWSVEPQNSYVAKLERKGCRRGSCLHLVPSPDSERPNGVLHQTFDPSHLQGRVVVVRYAARLDPGFAHSRASIAVATYREGQSAAVTGRAVPVASSRWEDISYPIIIPPDASRATVTITAVGGASVFVDSFKLQPEKRLETGETTLSRELTPTGLDNLVAFTKLFAMIRYFHPSRGARSIRWPEHAVEGVRKLEPAGSAEELVRLLRPMYEKAAPTIRVFNESDTSAVLPQVLTGKEELDSSALAMRHVGFGLPRTTEAMGSMVTEEFLQDPQELRIEQMELGRGVKARVPLQLIRDSTARSSSEFQFGRAQPITSLPAYLRGASDRSGRLASVIMAWSAIRYFYPYETKADWEQVLRSALIKAAVDKTDVDFRVTLQRMLAVLEDGFAAATYPAVARGFRGYELGIVQGQVTVIAANEGAEARVGDVVTKLNGRPVDELRREATALRIGANPECQQLRGMSFIFETSVQDKNQLTLDRLRLSQAANETRRSGLRELLRQPVVELEPGLFYVDLTRVSDKGFEAVLKQLSQARGIVFDARGPLAASPAILEHLATSPIAGLQTYVPIVTRPGEFDFQRSASTGVRPKTPLSARSVFLADERSLGNAEALLSMVRHGKIGPIVGASTCGAGGQPVRLALLGAHSIQFSGTKVLLQDGSPLHGVGIQPDAKAVRTRLGLALGREEVVEKALAMLREPGGVGSDGQRD
ncbi:MAG TPA: S41 family peptidase [Bryobacteraceae bacterium]|nr:S41 family peptidase [Bryobacteraceae bacterium]